MPATAPTQKPRFYPGYDYCLEDHSDATERQEQALRAMREAQRAGKKAGTRQANREKAAAERGKKARDQASTDKQARNKLTRAMEMNADHSRDRDQLVDVALDMPVFLDEVTGQWVVSDEPCGGIIDPEGIWALANPPALLSDSNMISAHIMRDDIAARFFLDLETAALNPTAVHTCSAFAMRGDDRRHLDLNDDRDVDLLHSASEMHHWLFQQWLKRISSWIESGMGSQTAYAFMHNSAKFDGICTSSFFGLKAGDEGVLFMYRHEDVDYFIRGSISKFGDFPKITFLIDLGKNGSFRLEVLDSLALIATPLGSFATKDFKKTDTPYMFTHPVEWLGQHGYADFSVTEFNQYIKSAHRYELLEDGRWVTHWFINSDGVETFSMTPLVSEKHPRGHRYSDRTIEAICFWKSYKGADEMRYARHDVLMLGNALNRYYEICESFGIHNVGAYQTSAQIGAQGQIKAITKDMYILDENGKVIFEKRDGFAVPFPKSKYPTGRLQLTLSNGRKNWLLTEEESLEVMKTGKYLPKGDMGDDEEEGGKAKPVEFRTDGLMSRKGYTAQFQSWYISSFANRFFFMVQRGGRNEVIWAKNPDETTVVVLDANSMYPSVMRDGLSIRYPEKDYKGVAAYYNAIKGYPDSRLIQRGATRWMREAGLVASIPSTEESAYYGKLVFSKLKNIVPDDIRDEFRAELDAIEENFQRANAELKAARAALAAEENDENQQRFNEALRRSASYDFSALARFPGIRIENDGARVIYAEKKDRHYVIGRQSVLMMLQARAGVFKVKLPRSKCAFFRKISPVPVSLSGSDHDGRACYPDWNGGRLHLFITGEELQYFLTEETVADHLVEVDLNNSMHAPILGVAVGVTQNGLPYTHGTPISPFAEYIDQAWKARRECKRRIKEIDRAIVHLKEQGVKDILAIEELDAERTELKLKSLMIKNFMNAGGYGVQAQNVKPTIEFDSDDLTACLNSVLALSTQDNTWAPVDAFARRVIDSLDRLGVHKPKRTRMQSALEELGLGSINIADVKFADREQVSSQLAMLKNLFTEDQIKSAATGSALQYLVSTLEGLAKHKTWEDLSGNLVLLNEALKAKIEAADSIERVILSHREKSDEDAEQTIKRLALRSAFDTIGRKLLIESKHFGGEIPAVTSRRELWEVLGKRLSKAQEEIKGHLDVYRMIFAEFAANHFRNFQAMHLRMDDGRHVTRYMMSTIEETAAHANRAFAVAIPAKARVKLHQAMRALSDIGLEVAYFDTDSLHIMVPCTADQDPEQVLKEKLKGQSIITMGDDLGEWDIERKTVEKELAVGKWKAGDVIRADHVFYLGKKVIMFCDDEYNILDCRVAGISLRETKQRAALMSIVKQTARLGDRAGLITAPPTLMDRLTDYDYGTRDQELKVCGMYANSTRIYEARRTSSGAIDRSGLGSTAVVLSMDNAKKQLKVKHSADGSVTYDHKTSRTVMSCREAGIRYSNQGYARNYDRGLESLEEARRMFLEKCKIGGVPVDQVREEIKAQHAKLVEQHRAGDIAYDMDDEHYASLASESLFGEEEDRALLIEQAQELENAVMDQLA